MLPQGERLWSIFPVSCIYVISIHAPTRGATRGGLFPHYCLGISIHAPTRGATKTAGGQGEGKEFQSTLPQGERRFQHPIFHQLENFNPRSHKGSDFDVAAGWFIVVQISIHAPTRGATDRRSDRRRADYFNPRSHKGSDEINSKALENIDISIHAPTRGATKLFQLTNWLT